MMYYLPLAPYHSNLFAYWRENSRQHPDEDLWSWTEREWGATVLVKLAEDAGRWRFNTEKDATIFAIRWG